MELGVFGAVYFHHVVTMEFNWHPLLVPLRYSVNPATEHFLCCCCVYYIFCSLTVMQQCFATYYSKIWLLNSTNRHTLKSICVHRDCQPNLHLCILEIASPFCQSILYSYQFSWHTLKLFLRKLNVGSEFVNMPTLEAKLLCHTSGSKHTSIEYWKKVRFLS